MPAAVIVPTAVLPPAMLSTNQFAEALFGTIAVNCCCCAVVTAVFVALLGWLVIETQGGSDLGLAERLFLSTETCWPFVVTIALRQISAARGDYPTGSQGR